MKANLRIVVLAVAVAAACTDAFAQFGVNIGYMNSTTYSRVEGVEGSEKAGTNGFAVGIDHNIRLIGNLLSIQPGIYYQHLLKSEDIAEISGLAAREAGGVLTFPLQGNATVRYLYMIHGKGRHIPGIARDFYEYVLNYLFL